MDKFLICLLILLSGCGYQLGMGSLPSQYHSISVPYVKGDKTGELTSLIVREISQSGAFSYKQSCGELSLKVEIINFTEENVGFRYDHNNEGERNHSIIPSEARIRVLAEVTVVETTSQKIVLGPARITSFVDFDYDYYSSPHHINEFSLGQLTDYETADVSVRTPLYQKLSQKIVDFVIQSW